MASAKAARRAKFETVFSKIRDELIEDFSVDGMPRDAVEWYRNVRVFFFSSIYYNFWLKKIYKKKNIILEPQLQCTWR